MINDELPIGVTPLIQDAANELIPKGASTRAQLDEFESKNIQQTSVWAMPRKKMPSDILNIRYCLKLHKKIFNKT